MARNTRDAVVVTFDLPDTLSDEFAFLPGYLTLRTQLNGGCCAARTLDLFRPRTTSCCAWPSRRSTKARSPVTQPRTATGPDAGAMAPAGNFTVDFAREPASPMCLRGGQRTTPVFSLVKTALSTEPRSNHAVLWQLRIVGRAVREEIEDLKNLYMSASLVYASRAARRKTSNCSTAA